jgi:periplasmic protein TonB
MESTGFLDAKPRHPGALATVIAVHVVGIGALMVIAPVVVERVTKILTVKQIPLPIDPPVIVDEPTTKVKVKTTLPIDRPVTKVTSKPEGERQTFAQDPGPIVGTGTGEGLGGGGIDWIEVDPPKPPVIVGPQFSGRNAQPPYPPGMQRLNIEGAVTVRVLVGADGRPVRIDMVRADQDAFFAATREWGMKNWRFKPATRDGEAFQEWRTMTVRFEMN